LSYQIRHWYWSIVQPCPEGEPNPEFRWAPHLDGGLDSFNRLWITSIWLRLAEVSIRHHLDMRQLMAALAALYPERPKKVTPTELEAVLKSLLRRNVPLSIERIAQELRARGTGLRQPTPQGRGAREASQAVADPADEKPWLVRFADYR
jgi:hypothetical protein